MFGVIYRNKLFVCSLLMLAIIAWINKADFLIIGTDILHVCGQTLVILILMFGLLACIKPILDSGVIKEKISRASDYKSMTLAALLGLVISGPIYPGFTLGKMLLANGVRVKTIIILLSVWGTLKLPMLPFEIDILGGKYTLIRWVVTGIGIVIMSLLCDFIITALNRRPTQLPPQ
ncbi:hypothetical protein [Brenneria tiliae]|uniref:Permease n=1 Tax=Brenneria tiliae TaxID=2914984 RepID=A0ABT0MPB7_9GAMM|nr:hypothetical protein [Brenneria tiliae]MCL2891683.1 hypothetical protein [Brenneria tiliae]